jgi:hypothetical protein
MKRGFWFFAIAWVGCCFPLSGCLGLFQEMRTTDSFPSRTSASLRGAGAHEPDEPQNPIQPAREGKTTDYAVQMPPPPPVQTEALTPRQLIEEEPLVPEPGREPTQVVSAEQQGGEAVIRAGPELTLAPEPACPDHVLVQALRLVLANRSEQAQALLREQRCCHPEMLLALLQIAQSMESTSPQESTPEHTSLVLERLDELAEMFCARAPLMLDCPCFCRHIETFGVYEPLPGVPSFQAGLQGQPGERMQAYVQVRNFISQKKGPFYETALSSSLEILDPAKQVVTRMDFPACIDRSRSRRQDYFINFRFHVPPRIPRGRYTLRIQVHDEGGRLTGKPEQNCVSWCSLDFHVR